MLAVSVGMGANADRNAGKIGDSVRASRKSCGAKSVEASHGNSAANTLGTKADVGGMETVFSPLSIMRLYLGSRFSAFI